MRRIYTVGLTGQTGAGKSSVCQLLRQAGIPVIDADRAAREVVGEGKQCLADLALEFSIGILNADGTLNRRKLAAIAFSDKRRLERLNAITFPYIRQLIAERIDQLDKAGKYDLVVIDAPTLFESGTDKMCDFVVSVIAPKEERLSRIIIRDRLTDEQARERMGAQQEDAFYIDRSDVTLRNDGDQAALSAKATELMTLLRENAAGRRAEARP
mgnify:CR=1 FL=1